MRRGSEAVLWTTAMSGSLAVHAALAAALAFAPSPPESERVETAILFHSAPQATLDLAEPPPQTAALALQEETFAAAPAEPGQPDLVAPDPAALAGTVENGALAAEVVTADEAPATVDAAAPAAVAGEPEAALEAMDIATLLSELEALPQVAAQPEPAAQAVTEPSSPADPAPAEPARPLDAVASEAHAPQTTAQGAVAAAPAPASDVASVAAPTRQAGAVAAGRKAQQPAGAPVAPPGPPADSVATATQVPRAAPSAAGQPAMLLAPSTAGAAPSPSIFPSDVPAVAAPARQAAGAVAAGRQAPQPGSAPVASPGPPAGSVAAATQAPRAAPAAPSPAATTPGVPVAAAPIAPVASPARPAAPVGQGGQVAVVRPLEPQTVSPLQSPAETYSRLLDAMAADRGGGCFLALASLKEEEVGVDGFAADPEQVGQLDRRLADELDAPVDVRGHTVSDTQCAALGFANALADGPEASLSVELAAALVASGGELAGRVGNIERRWLYLLVVDQAGKVQEVPGDRVVREGAGTVGFSVPLTRVGDPVETVQLLLAVASDEILEMVWLREGYEAGIYFEDLREEILANGGSIDFGIAPFVLR